MNSYPTDNHTIGAGREYLIANRKDGTKCPLCHRHAKIYARRPNGSMCYVLIALYKRLKQGTDPWVHVGEYLGQYLQGSPMPDKLKSKIIKGDWPKARLWGLLIERQQVQPDGNPSSGIWALTQQGVDFIEGKITIYHRAYEYHSELLGFDVTKWVTIQEALKKSFNYAELMGP